jgi:hypothetical protein
MTTADDLRSLLPTLSWDELKQLRDELRNGLTPYTGTYAEPADDDTRICRHCGQTITCTDTPDAEGESWHVNSTETMCIHSRRCPTQT